MDNADKILRAASVVCATIIVSNIDQKKQPHSDKEGMALIESIAESFYQYMLNDNTAMLPKPDMLPVKK
jgi:hypothetical protein